VTSSVSPRRPDPWTCRTEQPMSRGPLIAMCSSLLVQAAALLRCSQEKQGVTKFVGRVPCHLPGCPPACQAKKRNWVNFQCASKDIYASGLGQGHTQKVFASFWLRNQGLNFAVTETIHLFFHAVCTASPLTTLLFLAFYWKPHSPVSKTNYRIQKALFDRPSCSN